MIKEKFRNIEHFSANIISKPLFGKQTYFRLKKIVCLQITLVNLKNTIPIYVVADINTRS